MEYPPIRDNILMNFKKVTSSAKLPVGIVFKQGDTEGTVKMQLSCKAVSEENMQTNSVAFEAWALLIRVHCGLRVQLEIEQLPIGQRSCHGHYARFLYRVMKFETQYGDWFSVVKELKSHVDAFRTWLTAHRFCNNVPTKQAENNDNLENMAECAFAETSRGRQLLSQISLCADIPALNGPICRQLPVGLFQGGKAQGTSVFTGKKSAIDLWSVAGDNRDSIVIYELKTNNRKVGILTELMFYANYMYDMYVARNQFQPLMSGPDFRGYSILFNGKFANVHAAMLTDGLHPLITGDVVKLMNQGCPQIYYHDLRYRSESLLGPAADKVMSS